MALDRTAPFEEVESPVAPNGFDHTKPFEELTPDHETNWSALFNGVDYARSKMGPEDRASFARLASLNDNSADIQKQAINQSYVGKLLPNMPTAQIQQNWPAVRQSFAKSALGIQEEVSDGTLYEAINKRVNTDLQTRWSGSKTMDRLKMMFGSHGYGETPVAESEPMIGSGAAGTKGSAFTIPKMEGKGTMVGLINAANKMTAGLTTPENASLMVTTGGAGTVAELAAMTRAAVVARSVQAAGLGTFTVIGAMDTAHAVSEAKLVVNDPKATNADKSEAIATAVFSAAMTAAAAKGTYDFSKMAKVEAGGTDANAARVEAVNHLREQAAEADKSTAKTLNQVADEIEALPPIAEKPAETTVEAPKREAVVEELDNGGFVVTNNKGELIDYAQTKTEANKLKTAFDEGKEMTKEGVLAKETAQKEAEAVPTPEQEQKAAESAKSAVVGIKNASVDEAFAKMGLEPPEHGAKLSFEEARADAAAKMDKDPRAGETLVNTLHDNPRPVTGKENALLLHELTRLTKERADAETAFVEATKMGDKAEAEAAKARVDKAQADYIKAAEVDTRVGTENAIGLALRRMMMKEDYSLAAMERRRMVANDGKALTPEQRTEVTELHEKIAATQKAFDDYVASQNKVVPFPKQGKVAAKITELANGARDRIKQRRAEGRAQSGLDPTDLADHAIIGAEYLAKGVKEFAAWSEAMVKELGESIKPHLKAIFAKANELKSDETRLTAKKTRLEKGTEELKERIANKDFSPKEKPKSLHLDEEANRLQAEHDLAKLEYDRLLERDRYENSSAISKATQQGLGFYDAARMLMTTGEFSFILRQGKVGVLSHPLMAAKALPNTFKAFMEDPAGAHAINLQVLNHPDAAAARQAKLHLLDEGASLHKQEEILIGKILGEKLPVVGKALQKFNQAATVFLNRLRFDMWQNMRKVGLDAAGDKQVAMFVNEATGRGGLGSLEAAAVPLGRLMFSPRYFASRIQLAAGHSMWGGTMQTRRIIAGEYARTLVGLGVYYTALNLYLQSIGKKDVEISDDPRSSDFGKVKIGNSRIDPLAGVAQVAVFAARTATGEKTNSKGKTTDIRGTNVPFGGDRWSDVAANFARSKLHPVPGAIVNLFDGTDLGGNEATIANQGLNMSGPVTYVDIYQALEEQDLPEGVSLGLLAMLGEGLQTYDPKKQTHKQPPSRK